MISKRYFKTKDEVDVTFKTSTVGPVEGVSLLCDFNGWNPIPMRAITKRTWKKTVRLPIDVRGHDGVDILTALHRSFPVPIL